MRAFLENLVRLPYHYLCRYVHARYSIGLQTANHYEIGSPQWLIAAERQFGGRVTGIERRKVSERDPRSPRVLATGGMVGGDRMYHHKYARTYSRHLSRFISARERPFTIIEVGILRGSGLALWSLLFPNADVIGLDIDPSHFYDNLAFLKRQGAFANKEPEIYEFDQFHDNNDMIRKVLKDRAIDIMMDDGLHANEAILKTADSVRGALSKSFVYFIEDNATVSPRLAEYFPAACLFSYGELTVIDSAVPFNPGLYQ